MTFKQHKLATKSQAASQADSSATIGVTSQHLKDAFADWGTGVCVVTAYSKKLDISAGITINSFTPVSLAPPQILWCLQASYSLANVFLSASLFAVHILAADQRHLAQQFARSSKGVANIDNHPEGLPPPIAGCLSSFLCSVDKVVDGGDHHVIFGLVEKVNQPQPNTSDKNALRHWRRNYFSSP